MTTLIKLPVADQIRAWAKEGRARREELSLCALHPDPIQYQSRCQIDMEHVQRLHELIELGTTLEPVVVFEDEQGTLRLADGFHRYEAARKAGKLSLAAWVVEGGADEAILYSVSANLLFSLAPTKSDRLKAVRMLADHPDFRYLSDREIAERCGVSPATVSVVRQKLAQETGRPVPDVTSFHRNGQTVYMSRPIRDRMMNNGKQTAARQQQAQPDPDALPVAPAGTPGPWTVRQTMRHGWIVVAASGRWVASDLREADARRVALVPELLQFLARWHAGRFLSREQAEDMLERAGCREVVG